MSKYLDLTGLTRFWNAFKARLLPSGGSSGQVLAKASGTNYDVGWVRGASPYDSSPKMDGTAAAGTSDDYARGDHVHPTDTSRQEALSVTSGTLTKGSSASSYTYQVRKYGHIVQLNINQLKLASALASGSSSGTITTIESGYRPHHTIYMPWTSSGAAYGYAIINISGTVTIRNCSAVSLATTATVTIACTYIVN